MFNSARVAGSKSAQRVRVVPRDVIAQQERALTREQNVNGPGDFSYCSGLQWILISTFSLNLMLTLVFACRWLNCTTHCLFVVCFDVTSVLLV